jgi:PAS domain S-box-containing protein
MGVYDYDVRTGRIEWDERIRAIWGVGPDEQVDFDIFMAGVEPDDRQAVRDAIALAFTAGGDGRYEADYRVRHRATGVVRWVRAVGDAHFEDGEAVTLVGTVADITDLCLARDALRESEARLRLILDGTLAFIGVLTPEGEMLEANAPALAAGGMVRADVIGRPFWDCYWWNFDPEVQARLRDAIERCAAGEVVRYDTEVRMAGDSRIFIDFMLSPVRDDTGRIHLLVPSGFDISARKADAERIGLLIREVNHRSKNMLSVVQAVARQTQRLGGADWATHFSQRIDALAAGHDLLVRSEWRPVLLDDLVRSQLAHFSDLLDRRILIAGSDVTVGAMTAQAIGMAVHELATNAGKYGALSGASGIVRIWWGEDDDAPGQFFLRWQEEGGPTVKAPKRRGFGSTVLDAVTRQSLGARVEIDFDPAGLRWRMDCPRQVLAR